MKVESVPRSLAYKDHPQKETSRRGRKCPETLPVCQAAITAVNRRFGLQASTPESIPALPAESKEDLKVRLLP